jgi:hypothetical protein
MVRPAQSQLQFGDRWLGEAEGPYLVDHTSDVHLVVSASNQRIFSLNAGSYIAPPDYNATLIKTSEEDKKDYDGDFNTSDDIDVFRLTEFDSGDVFVFAGFDGDVATHYQGRLVERTTRPYIEASRTGIRYARNTNGFVTQMTPATPGYTINYAYHTTGSLANRLQKVELKKGSTVLAQAEYWYKASASVTNEFPATPSNDLGSDTDLVQVKVSLKDSDDTGANFSITRYTHYRYFKSGDGDGGVHQLKAVYEPDAVQRILSAGNSAFDTPAEILASADAADVIAMSTKIHGYASRSFTYYTSLEDTTESDTPWDDDENLEGNYGIDPVGFSETAPLPGHSAGVIKSEKINGACASCGGSTTGGVEKRYFHWWLNYYLNFANANDNEVIQLTVEDTVDSLNNEQYRRIYGVNKWGVAIRQALLTNPVTPDDDNIWCWSKLVNSKLRTTEERMPSAHKSEVTSNSELQQFLDPYDAAMASFANDVATVSTSEGVVYYYEYDADGYPTGKLVRKGAGTTNRFYVEGTTWTNYGTNGARNFLPSSTFKFPTTNYLELIETQYTYTFWSGSDNTALATATSTLPDITTGQNGSGTSTTTVRYFDKLGRLRWTKDGEGYVNYYSYHPCHPSANSCRFAA